MTRQRAEFTVVEPYEFEPSLTAIGTESGFPSDVAFEISGLMESTEVRNVRVIIEWEGGY